MAVLGEIIQGAASNDMPLSTLLRKCLVLASRLDSRPVEEWVDWELNGYPDEVEVPPYRRIGLIVKANLVDYTKRISGWAVPPELLGEYKDGFTNIYYRASVGSIEHELAGGKTALSFHMENLLTLLRHLNFTHMEITSAWTESSAGQIKHILDTARTRVLKFVLELEKEYPNAGGELRNMSAGKVDQIFINNIYGSANVVGKASNSQVTLTVVAGDFSSLSQSLQNGGLSDNDISHLRQAIADDPAPTAAGFGPKVSAWMGRMISKAADGSWTIGAGAAANLLSNALSKYYGL